METKLCNSCNIPKSIDQFHKMKHGKYGVRSTCKECSSAKMKIYRNTDEFRLRHAAKMKKYRLENPEKWNEISKRFYEKHKTELHEKAKIRRSTESGKEKIRMLHIKRKLSGKRLKESYSTEDWEEHLKKARLYKKSCPESVKQKISERGKNWRKSLPDSYVGNCCLKIKDYKNIPVEILDVKRLVISINRELKSKNDGQN